MIVQKILVVDNSPVSRRIVQSFFEKKGCEVRSAEDGFAALEILDQFCPDLMVVDLVMPKIGGEELCRIVRNRRQHRNTAIIILSAVIAECKIDFEALQIDACIAKEAPNGINSSLAEVLTEIEAGHTRKNPPRFFAQERVAHREITEELLHKARHFEIILQNMADIFIEFSPEGRIVQLNNSAAALFGKKEDVLGKELLFLFPEAEREKLKKMIEALKISPGQPSREFLLNDKIIRVSLMAGPARSSSQEESILLFGNEMTEQCKVEGDLRQILNTAADGLVVIDRDFKILKANNTFLEMFQEEENILGRECFEVIHGLSCNTAQCPMIQVFEEGKAIEFEEEKYRRDGTGFSCLIKATPYTDYKGNLVGIVEDFRDITARKIAETTIKESEERFRDILDNSPHLIQNISPEGKFLYVNPAWKKTLEYNDDEVKKLYLSDILVPRAKKQCLEKFAAVLQGEDIFEIETEFVAKSGWIVSVSGSVSCKFKDGKPAYTRGIFRDITLQKALEEKLHRLATTDELTGCYNRRMFKELCSKEISRAKRQQQPFSVAILDIDYFKNINDTHGHDMGDFVLKNMAQLCMDQIRRDDSLARWGGEEFMVLLPNTGQEKAMELCERLRRAIAGHGFLQLPQITVSLGLTEFIPEDGIESLVKRADQALYAAKKSGRNKVCTS